MKAFLKALALVPVAAVVLGIAYANRHFVRIGFDPFDPGPSQYDVNTPMFVVLFAVLMLGIVVGGAASWRAQGKYRREARLYRAEAERLRAELSRPTPGVGERAGTSVRAIAGGIGA
jgi:hypothetical protein